MRGHYFWLILLDIKRSGKKRLVLFSVFLTENSWGSILKRRKRTDNITWVLLIQWGDRHTRRQPCRHNNLNLDIQCPSKKQPAMTLCCTSSPVEDKRIHRVYWEVSLAESMNSGFSERVCLKSIWWRVKEEDSWHQSLASQCTRMHLHWCIQTCIHIQIQVYNTYTGWEVRDRRIETERDFILKIKE